MFEFINKLKVHLDELKGNAFGDVNQSRIRAFIKETLSQEAYENWSLSQECLTIPARRDSESTKDYAKRVKAYLDDLQNEFDKIQKEVVDIILRYRNELLFKFHKHSFPQDADDIRITHKMLQKLVTLQNQIIKLQQDHDNHLKKVLQESMASETNTITVRIWHRTPAEKRDTTYGFNFNGHISIDICNKSGERQYISFCPGDNLNNTDNTIVNYLAKKLHLPKYTDKEGVFISPLHDAAYLYISDDYVECQEIVLKGEQIDVDAAFQYASTLLQKESQESPSYHFYNNNCATMGLTVLQHAGVEKLIKFPRDLVIQPQTVFDYAKSVATKLDYQNKDQLFIDGGKTTDKESAYRIFELTSNRINGFSLLRKLELASNGQSSDEDESYLALKDIFNKLNAWKKQLHRNSITDNVTKTLITISKEFHAFFNTIESYKLNKSEKPEIMGVLLDLKKWLQEYNFSFLSVVMQNNKTAIHKSALQLTNNTFALGRSEEDKSSSKTISGADLILICNNLIEWPREFNDHDKKSAMDFYRRINESQDNAPPPYKSLKKLDETIKEMKKVLSFDDTIKNPEASLLNQSFQCRDTLQWLGKHISKERNEIPLDNNLIRFYIDCSKEVHKQLDSINKFLYFDKDAGLDATNNSLLSQLKISPSGTIQSTPNTNNVASILKNRKRQLKLPSDMTVEKKAPSIWNLSARYAWFERNTQKQVAAFLEDPKISPAEANRKIQQLIAHNKPSMWEFWANKEPYDKMAVECHFLCALTEFIRGQISEKQFICKVEKVISDYKDKIDIISYQNFIKSFKDKNLTIIEKYDQSNDAGQGKYKERFKKQLTTYQNLFKEAFPETNGIPEYNSNLIKAHSKVEALTKKDSKKKDTTQVDKQSVEQIVKTEAKLYRKLGI